MKLSFKDGLEIGMMAIWSDIEDDPNIDPQKYFDLWGEWKESLDLPHRGDCTNECFTCIRCNTESIIKCAKALSKDFNG